MISGRNILCDTQLFAQLPSEFGSKSWISVANDLGGESETHKHVFKVEGSSFFHRDFFYAWNKY